MQSSGYTPLSAFRKPITNQSPAIEDKINLKTPIVATTDQEGISGKMAELHIVCLHTNFTPISQDTSHINSSLISVIECSRNDEAILTTRFSSKFLASCNFTY